jgi:hypothetical protein
VLIRCVLDGLLLPACLVSSPKQRGWTLRAHDGVEAFALEAVEALYYEVVQATPEELLALEQAQFRLLRRSLDFSFAGG